MSSTIDSLFSKKKPSPSEACNGRTLSSSETLLNGEVDANGQKDDVIDISSSSDSDNGLTIADLLKEKKEASAPATRHTNNSAIEDSAPKSNTIEEEQKRLSQLIDQVKRNESLLYLMQRRAESINSRLREIDRRMANPSPNTSGNTNAFLSLYVLDHTKNLAAAKGCSEEEVAMLLQLWMHLTHYNDVYNLSLSNVDSIFAFYEELKALAREGSRCEDVTRLSASSLETYQHYCCLCRTALTVILHDFKEPDLETLEEEKEEKASLSDDSPKSSLYASLFQNLDIGSHCVSSSTWLYVCEMLFWSYVEEPGLSCPGPVVEQMKACFEKVRTVPVWKWESGWMLVVLEALCEMASDSVTMLDKMDEQIARRKSRVKERMERKKKEVVMEDPKPVERHDPLVPDPSMTEEQKQFVTELMSAVENKDVEEVKVILSRAKTVCFQTKKRSRFFPEEFRPFIQRANALLEEAKKQARRQAALREKRRRDAEEMMEIMDLLPSPPLLGCDHYGNRYFFMPRDYRGVYVLCDQRSVSDMTKESERVKSAGFKRAKEAAGEEARAWDAETDREALFQRAEAQVAENLPTGLCWRVIDSATGVRDLMGVLSRANGKEKVLLDSLNKNANVVELWSEEAPDASDASKGLTFHKHMDSVVKSDRGALRSSLQSLRDDVDRFIDKAIRLKKGGLAPIEWEAQASVKNDVLFVVRLFHSRLHVPFLHNALRPLEKHLALVEKFVEGACEGELEVVVRWLQHMLMHSKAVRDVMSKKEEVPAKPSTKPSTKSSKKSSTKRLAMYLEEDSSEESSEDVRRGRHASKKRRTQAKAGTSKQRRRLPSYEESTEESEESLTSQDETELSEEDETEPSEEDEWDEYCKICGKGGELICCDGCPSSFHLRCLHMRKVPAGEWFCPECRQEVCGVCKKSGLGIHDNIVCGNEEGTKGCERMFHLKCVGLKEVPEGDWYCPDCMKKMQ